MKRYIENRERRDMKEIEEVEEDKREENGGVAENAIEELLSYHEV